MGDFLPLHRSQYEVSEGKSDRIEIFHVICIWIGNMSKLPKLQAWNALF